MAVLPGQYFDAETGLHQNWHRDYDPSVGRYMQSDPIGLKGGSNTYAYANSNPCKYIDRSGLWSGADAFLAGYFFSGMGGHVDISAWCDDYLADVTIQSETAVLKREVDRKAKDLVEIKGKTVFSITKGGWQYVTSIYSFGAGNTHKQTANCVAEGDGCCVTVDCKLQYEAWDIFKDPVDLCQAHGICDGIQNVGGIPFSFGLSCAGRYGTGACK